jgi:hypothetical protein
MNTTNEKTNDTNTSDTNTLDDDDRERERRRRVLSHSDSDRVAAEIRVARRYDGEAPRRAPYREATRHVH